MKVWNLQTIIFSFLNCNVSFLWFQSTRRGLFRSPSDPSGGKPSLLKSKSFAFELHNSGSPSLTLPAFPTTLTSLKSISPRTTSSKRSEPCSDDAGTPSSSQQCKRRKSVVDTQPIEALQVSHDQRSLEISIPEICKSNILMLGS